jgi:hypothetical protein
LIVLVGHDRHLARGLDDVMRAGAGSRRQYDVMRDCRKRREPMERRHAEKRDCRIRNGKGRKRGWYGCCAGLAEDERDGKHVQRDEHEDAERRPPVLDVPETQRDESVWIRCCD